MGAGAAFIEAATYVVGFALYFTLLASARYGAADVDPVQHVAFLVDHQGIMTAWYLVIYVVNGVFLVVLALALHERLRAGAPAVVRTATVFGFLWAGLVIASGMVATVGIGVLVDLYGRDPAQAATVWVVHDLVINGLGGGNEIVGGVWVLLLSGAALQGGGLPRGLAYLGLVIGGAGLLTTIPPLQALGAVFGLGFIGWFVGVGFVLMRTNRNQPVDAENKATTRIRPVE